MKQVIGFVGLGNMGSFMAGNLADAGYTVHVWNRTREKADPLIARGAQWVARPADVAQAGSIVITMLSHDQAVEEIAGEGSELAARIGNGGIHLSMSTISPATARKLSDHHKGHGVSYVAAPVFGRPEAAAARKLWICVSGPAAARERVQPVLKALGQGVFDFGEDPGAANVVKLAGNFLIAAAMEAMAEAFALAQKNGIERAAVADLFGQTLFACPVYQNYGKTIAQERYSPAGFRLPLGLKDVDLVLQMAAAAQMPMPVASLLHDRYITAMAKGRGSMDWSALALGVSEDAGLK
ncbi:MAG: NAD(P)-dependent oxidoreductase [Acidobacteriia bacterium]|nr:NAD(P)-dependent oxidoreductase [Terriglobia bacterium]